jgi:hypothetical protein
MQAECLNSCAQNASLARGLPVELGGILGRSY